jgi:hypothetical protein
MMSSGNLDRRVDRIEAHVGSVGCPACRDRPTLEIRIGDDGPTQPDSCALCGRDFTETAIVLISERPDGPQ